MTTELGISVLEMRMLDAWADWLRYPNFNHASRAMESADSLIFAVGTEAEVAAVLPRSNMNLRFRSIAGRLLGPEIPNNEVIHLINEGKHGDVLGKHYSDLNFYYYKMTGPDTRVPRYASLPSYPMSARRWPTRVSSAHMLQELDLNTKRTLGDMFSVYRSTLKDAVKRESIGRYRLFLKSPNLRSFHTLTSLMGGAAKGSKVCEGLSKLFLGSLVSSFALYATFTQIYESNPEQRTDVIFASVQDMFKPLPIAVFEALVA